MLNDPPAPPCPLRQALQNYKFKVKLTPGTVKKGKAARQALELLVRAPEAAQREKELLKAIPEMDMVNAMVRPEGSAAGGWCVLGAGLMSVGGNGLDSKV